MHNNPEILSKLLAAIGRKVAFQYPGGEGEKRGILKDRAIIPSNPGEAGVPYWDVVDLITFQNEPQPEWIRIGYYRRPKDRLIWGSQTTITEPVGVWRRILTEAARQKPWFRKLLLEVVDAIRGENAQQ